MRRDDLVDKFSDSGYDGDGKHTSQDSNSAIKCCGPEREGGESLQSNMTKRWSSTHADDSSKESTTTLRLKQDPDAGRTTRRAPRGIRHADDIDDE